MKNIYQTRYIQSFVYRLYLNQAIKDKKVTTFQKKKLIFIQKNFQMLCNELLISNFC